MSSCPLCSMILPIDRKQQATHLFTCSQNVLTSLNTLSVPPPPSPSSSPPSSPKSSTPTPSPGSSPRPGKKKESSKKKAKIDLTCDMYDLFLKEVKDDRFKRNGPWTGPNQNTSHICNDAECEREWKPTPLQCLVDDYYCPSCVLHHRNNVDRFSQARLAWSAHVPNTFYVFTLIDPTSKEELVKFGRTQHLDPYKRYSGTELKKYSMKLVLNLRGRLETMTKVENWWKSEGLKLDIFMRFSDSSFHGLSECLKMDPPTLEKFLDHSKKIHKDDHPHHQKWIDVYLEKRAKILNE
eukprot:TRINITY_DN5149_c0_g1_i1.p1 TRINITY_DN5149_c0_g1~~TRINITY_DN5149_c0_g1_i1.p1  ORF type:complete len:295 (-),score=65.92 TRINITY_DN5149_c0_g1_i1:40-924(-)